MLNFALAAEPVATTRRRLLLAAAATATPAWALAQRAIAPTAIDVWKRPTCGCCKDWITHMEANGFKASVHMDGNTDQRAALGIPIRFGSCHTALVGGYAIEGHVPAREVRRLLAQKAEGRWIGGAGDANRLAAHGWARIWRPQGQVRRAARAEGQQRQGLPVLRLNLPGDEDRAGKLPPESAPGYGHSGVGGPTRRRC